MAKQHYKNLIHNLITQDNKLKAINITIAQEQDPQAKKDIEKIK